MGMYGSALSPVVSPLNILIQGIREPNVEYADGDYVDEQQSSCPLATQGADGTDAHC
jgi:hypothetical protein